MRMKQKKLAASLFMLFISLLLVACTPTPAETSSKWINSVASLMPAETLTELCESPIIVRGKVGDVKDTVLKTFPSNDWMILTDFYVDVDEVIKGNNIDKENVFFRVTGGETEDKKTITTAGLPEKGTEYYFFIRESGFCYLEFPVQDGKVRISNYHIPELFTEDDKNIKWISVEDFEAYVQAGLEK